MRLFRRPLSRAFVIGMVLLWAAGTALAQAPATTPLAYPPPQLTLAEARAIIEGAIAYARESNMRMAVPRRKRGVLGSHGRRRLAEHSLCRRQGVRLGSLPANHASAGGAL